MTYNTCSPVRPIAGRLALDFLNTANWSAKDQVIEEKIENMADLDVWMSTLDLSHAVRPASVEDVHTFRSNLRSVFLAGSQTEVLGLNLYLHTLEIGCSSPVEILRRQPILGLVAVSALSILSDAREMKRVKKCPGTDCGWLFIDETKNARRKWCIMETCGNRAKASRNYARKTRS